MYRENQTSNSSSVCLSDVHTYKNTLQKKSRQITFRIGTCHTGTTLIFDEVDAVSYKQAANIVAKHRYGHHAYARRITGQFEDMSGYFQAYITLGSKSERRGEPFHVQKVSSNSMALAAAAATS